VISDDQSGSPTDTDRTYIHILIPASRTHRMARDHPPAPGRAAAPAPRPRPPCQEWPRALGEKTILSRAASGPVAPQPAPGHRLAI